MKYQLSDILFLTVFAVICGAEGWDEIEDVGHTKLDFICEYGNFSAANWLVLGQDKITEKSNEITVIPELFILLKLQGCLVTSDAMGWQKKIATQVLTQGAEYPLSVKENQPALAGAF